MTQQPDHEPVTWQEARSVRCLKLIALFKIVKGVLLLVLGVSLLFLDAWGGWMNAPLKWIANEILLQHSKAVTYHSSGYSSLLFRRIAPACFISSSARRMSPGSSSMPRQPSTITCVFSPRWRASSVLYLTQ